MKVLIIGLGVIGTTYGYVFQKEGHKVEHLIRDSKKAFVPENINVKLLDGRFNNKGEEKNDNYKIHIANKNSSYDFILVSVPAGKIEGVIKTLKENNINGTLIIFNGIWEDKNYIENLFKG
ncbi:ketopantoate reductase family protein [Clostridium beijerinckii]|uniref:ketopantoate reductase family protein n=1 Tax=Clostridium beijerinckii TaxID=1520 RepID=UPI0026842E88